LDLKSNALTTRPSWSLLDTKNLFVLSTGHFRSPFKMKVWPVLKIKFEKKIK